MKNRLLSSCLLAALASTSSAATLQVETRTMRVGPAVVAEESATFTNGWNQGSIKMPFVTTGPPEVARRMNDALFLGLLGLPAPTAPGPTFTQDLGALPDGITRWDYETRRADERVLSITGKGEGCGAYCEDFQRSISLDARTGRVLVPEDLFTPVGLGGIARRLDAERKRLYTDRIRQLEVEIAAAQGRPARPDEDVALPDRMDFAQDCLDRLKGAPLAAADLRPADMAFDAKALLLRFDRCSNHASRALDDVGDIHARVPLAELAGAMTPYGRALLLGDGDAPAPTLAFGQVLHGKVGDAPVTLLLGRPTAEDDLEGLYFYDKFRKPIELSGKRDGTAIDVTEHRSAGQIALRLHGLSATGTWQGKDKTLPVTLTW